MNSINKTFYSSIKTILNTIQVLTDENSKIKIELAKCRSKLEILSQLNINKEENIISDTSNGVSDMNNYMLILNKYFLSEEKDKEFLIKKLFKLPSVSPSDILGDIKNQLPKNINEVVKQFKCTKELSILYKSIENIKKKEKYYPETSRDVLEKKYHDSYTKNSRKQNTIKYMEQALIYFPFEFNTFLKNVGGYLFKDNNLIVAQLKEKWYGKNNILLTHEERKLLEENKPIKTKKKIKSRKKHIDYTIITIDFLVEAVKNSKSIYRRQTAINFLKQLRKTGKRSEEEFKEYIRKVNFFLEKKLEY